MAEVLVLGTADWDQQIATNQHYVVGVLSDLGHSVRFQESIGLRHPQFRLRDIKRVLKRLKPQMGKTSAGREVPRNVSVYSPRIIPLHARVFRPINTWLLANYQRANLRNPDLVWTYTPLTYGLERLAPVTVYHCVDLLGKFPGIDELLVANEERRLARSGAKAIASSEVVRQHLFKMGFEDVTLWPNVADLNVFQRVGQTVRRQPRRVVFAGNITRSKIDFSLLELVSDLDVELVLIGPYAEGGGAVSREVSQLMEKGVKFLGALRLGEVAKEFAKSHVGIIPYLINAYTSGVSPLKTYEYAAAGLPVVSTDLPGVEPDSAGVWKENDHHAFIERLKNLLAEPPGSRSEGLGQLASNNSWDLRAKQVDSLIQENIIYTNGE